MHTSTLVDYEWDPAKALANLRKHGVRFVDAAPSLEDPAGRTVPDPDSAGQERFVFLGADPSGRILVTAFTSRDKGIRIIPSRRACRAERRSYEARQ